MNQKYHRLILFVVRWIVSVIDLGQYLFFVCDGSCNEESVLWCLNEVSDDQGSLFPWQQSYVYIYTLYQIKTCLN